MAVTNFQNLTIAHPGAVKTLSTATTVRPAALSEVMFRVNRQAVQPASTELSATPLLSDGQEAQLKATPTVPTQGPAATQSVKDNMRPLATWLADPETALIRCALDRLSIKVPATAATGVQLFPLSGDPQATLINLPGHDEPLPLQVEPFDPTGNALILSLPFPDTALYEAVITAMQTYESAARITLTYTHPYAVMVTPPSHGVGFYHLNEAVTAKPAFMAASLKTTTFGHSTTPVQPIHPIPHTTTPEPPQQPQRQERSVTLQFTFPIYRSLDSQPDPYPNDPKPIDATVWHSWVDQDNANLSVLFKPSDSPDQFFYLPTAYKLGFFADEQGGLQPPISAQSYIKDDEYRVKVKLVALPYIDDDVREKVRANICSQVLKGALPFVQLIPAAGVACEFASSIVPVSDSSTSGQTLPASIQFIAGDDLAPDKLTFEFDMNAFDYALFGEILKHGIKGTLVVRDGKKFQQDIEVSMKLSDGEVIANSLVPNVELDTANNAATVTLTNRLDFPVELESARAFFTKYASLIPGMVFKSEPCLFLPAPDQPSSHFDEKGKDQACMVLPLAPPKEFKDWNQVGIALGTAIAKAGSAEDWLNRVNQDPSIQPQHVKALSRW